MLQEAYQLSGGVDHRPALALGSGIGRAGDVCGALTGSAIAIGLLCGDHIAGLREAKRRAQDLTLPFYRDFVAEFGVADCRSLIDLDLAAPGALQVFKERNLKTERCDKFIVFAVRRLLALRDEVAPDTTT